MLSPCDAKTAAQMPTALATGSFNGPLPQRLLTDLWSTLSRLPCGPL